MAGGAGIFAFGIIRFHFGKHILEAV